MITIKLHNLGKEYTAKGKTLAEAVDNLKAPMVRGHGVLVVSDGKKSKEKIMNARTLNKTFGISSPNSKRMAVKNIITLFSNFE